ncbi:bifunctional acetate--CoA ligase family protein/GNAT family N-acetyltransferase [Accumulibacter sp.]|uniref:bifunctional acetate--CoA ligase family protein/GNAT family N-acetyltransferase n=1 Tax=Accumulibacter sp. TaxID=2053492 RepID=UPI002609B299|nr:bifunctional acetate--CoA ligase family protein/GNAT family N-acetyltransferase [Accumulibacter sp.]
MTVRNLEFLFRPESVAVIAEIDEPSRYAEVVLANLAAGGFAGPVISADARKRSLFSMGSDVRLGEMELVPDLAIVCAALDNVASIVAQLGERGTRAVIVGPWLRHRMNSHQVLTARQAILEAARPSLTRVLGPGSGGLAVPARGFNASVSPVPVTPGKIALISQSTAVAAAVLDRAHSRGIGFSTVLHLGTSIDVDLADVLDWLAADQDTRSILVQFDSLPDGRKFMSAARAAARNKPVVSIRSRRVKIPRTPDGPFAVDEVYAAALRRAGWVGIDTLGDLFEAIEAMARVRPMRGERLTILANGHGLGGIAGDTLRRSGGQLGTLSDDTVKRLRDLLHTRSKLENPLALPADVSAAKWGAALAAVLDDSETDAVLTVCSPSPFAPSTEVAAAICAASKASERNVFTCWVGGSSMLEAQHIAAANGVLSHDSPEKAIAVFLGVLDYRRNRALLMQMPPSRAEGFSPDIDAARGAIGEAISAGAAILTARQARRVLQAYGIAVADYPLVSSVDAGIRLAEKIGYPVDLGLVLSNAADQVPLASGLRSPAEIKLAGRSLRRSVRAQTPGGRVSGYRLRPSVARSGLPALRLGVDDDPLFGLVIFLGPSATAGTRPDGFVIALPPLNPTLARDLVAHSHFADEAPRDQREHLESAASSLLVRLSQLLADNDAVVGIELDPLFVETSGVLVLDVRVRIRPDRARRKLGLRRFAIRPYPKELERAVDWHGRRLLIRPIRPEDESTLGELLNSLEPEDSRMRFFDSMRNLPRARLARFTQIDYDREMALVAVERGPDGGESALGEVRAVAQPGSTFADFAIVVASAIKGKGLGRLLLQCIIDYCRDRGLRELRGETLDGNLRMQGLANSLGFQLTTGSDRGTVDLRLALGKPQAK